MLFNSLVFIAFFALVLFLHRVVKSWSVQKSILLVASYVFYMAWSPPFVLLLWISTAVDWVAARKMAEAQTQSKKRFFLILSLLTNLGLLGYFKYGGFLMENCVSIMEIFGLQYQPPSMDIILPVGISFYTFQTLSYSLDVYLGRSQPAKSLLDFALYVTFFPQLVAGPIVRATDFLPQCEKPRRASAQMLSWGLFLMTLGLFQKVVLADAFLSPSADLVFGFARGPVHTLDAWLGLLAFSGQIFFDFAGYSTCAIGAALCLGFKLPDNFLFPYASIGFSDFWKRWHISLSTWLRDYLYIPLGGNRASKIRVQANLMITMLLGGLWHGASWNFVIWGGLHGVYLVAERWIRKIWGHVAFFQSQAGIWFLQLLTFFLVCITWIFFRAEDFERGKLLFLSVLGVIRGGAQILPNLEMWKVGAVIAALLLTHHAMRNTRIENVVQRWPSWFLGLVWAAMLILLILTQGGANAFIYFQF